MLDFFCPLSRRARTFIAWGLVALTCALSIGCDATIGDPLAVADARGQEVSDALVSGDGAVLPPADAAAAVDAAVDAAGGLLTCDESYGTAPGYVLCDERPDTCVFSAITNGGNCNQMCESLGGVCIEAFDNDPGAPCVANPGDDCTTAADDEICVCNRL